MDGRPQPAVLVVDDEEEVRTMLALVLANEGFRVEQAASGEDALAACAADEFAAVVLDQRMPRLTGIDVARRLIADGVSARIIIFSAYLGPAVREACEELGLEYLDKLAWPALVESCRRAVEEPLQRGR